MKTGLFFGTFNPVHKGHIAIAKFMAEKTDLDEVWMVVSPQNPFKKNEEIISDTYRLEMLEIAIAGMKKIKVCDEELRMPKPSYTINTVEQLVKQYPYKSFVLIMGEDNITFFNKWKDYQRLIDLCEIYVYPRAKGEKSGTYNYLENRKIKKYDFPLLPVSSTQIRSMIGNKENTDAFLPNKILQFIREKNLYCKN
jgi:nicotinate-nucleotide adenylyltransferase